MENQSIRLHGDEWHGHLVYIGVYKVCSSTNSNIVLHHPTLNFKTPILLK